MLSESYADNEPPRRTVAPCCVHISSEGLFCETLLAVAQVWGSWWLVATYWNYVRCAAARRPFVSRPWYRLWFGPAALRRFPLEPLVKVVLPLCGALGELWLGHESWRTLVGPDSKFVVDNINDWQHSAMYTAFATSGVIDLIGAAGVLPAGTERAFLGLAFLCQGLLLGFHLKGPPIEVMVHLILVFQVLATVAATAAEACAPRSVVAASARPALTLLQGVWWVQTAYIMFTADPAYDPDEMGGTMMAPVMLVVHMLWVSVFAVSGEALGADGGGALSGGCALGFLRVLGGGRCLGRVSRRLAELGRSVCLRAVLLALRALQSRVLGRTIHFTALKTSEGGHGEQLNGLDDEEGGGGGGGGGGVLEMSAFALPK
jgi:hypothetical protein